MPVFRSHITFEIARGLRALLNLDVGLTRGTLPTYDGQLRGQLAQARSRVERLQKQLSTKNQQLERMRKQLSESGRLPTASRPGTAGPSMVDGQSDRPAEDRFGSLIEDKKRLIDLASERSKIGSLADLGGLWNVDGGYTLYALERHDIDAAYIVDSNITEAWVEEKQKAYPGLRAIRGSFGDKEVAGQIGKVDAVIMFDVLLHQVDPDWDDVLKLYADQTSCFIVYNQQFVASDSTVRLLDLGEDGFLENTPHEKDKDPYKMVAENMYEIHPQYGKVYRDIHNIWQWGISDKDLITRMEKLGFSLQYFKNCGKPRNLRNFEHHAFIFEKASAGS